MHEPRPYGLHVIGGLLTHDDEVFIAKIAKQFINLKQVNELDNSKKVYDLPDGGFVICQDMGGVFRVIADKTLKHKEAFDGLAKGEIPMLYSGVMEKTVVKENQGLPMQLTEQTRLRLNDYKTEKLPPKRMVLERFRVECPERFDEFLPLEPDDWVHTQYEKLQPTWYSGAMSEVVQIVLGYGNQSPSIHQETIFTKYEKKQWVLPADVKKAIDKELENQRLPAYTGTPPSDGAVQYDYKFNQTHAIGFDSDKKPWLLKIDKTGVWAMPLPVIPATATKAFHDYIDNVGDSEIKLILDRFGAMPSGESFPEKDEDFYAWVRAGAISYVCDTNEFHGGAAYYTGCGWSLNASGNEGYNTCYNYDEDGIAWGFTYKLKLNLQPLAEQGKLSKPDKPLDYNAPFNQYLQALMRELNLGSVKLLTILYKWQRLGNAKILERATSVGFNPKGEADYWYNEVVPPEKKHTGSVNIVYAGRLYHNAKPEFQPQIKFPEPAMNACISFDFSPLGEHPVKPPNCDTVMFAYYIGDDLQTIKYFMNFDSYVRKVESDFEPVMTTGNYTQVETAGFSGLQGNFYTAEIDNRDEVAPVVMTTMLEGRDKGYDTKPFFSPYAWGSMNGEMWRNRYFTRLTKRKTDINRKLSIAVCIPLYCRNVALIATQDSIENVQLHEDLALYAVRDPTYYAYWTYHSVFAWFMLGSMTRNGKPFPVEGNPVWVEEKYYAPSPDNAFADNGDWAGGLPADYTWLIHPDSNSWQYGGGGSRPKVNEYSRDSNQGGKTLGKIQASILKQPQIVNNKLPSFRYFIASPDKDGVLFYRSANKIVCGESRYAFVREKDDDGYYKYWGFSRLANHEAVQSFFGVINE